MSSQKTSVAPYHDDYSDSKNFHQILFKPRRAVQIRELNQMQSILQAQIQRFGDHVFENGSMVIPGELNYNMQFDYVKVVGIDYTSVASLLNSGEVTIEDAASSTSAKLVVHTGPTATDPVTFFVQYISANNSSPGFNASAALNLKNAAGAVFATATAVGTGKGSVFDIAAGIFYINGSFIRTDSQRIILSKYTSTPSVVVGFRLQESIVTAGEDPSLYDNAAGTTNYNAIGADRLKKTLTLEVYPVGSSYNKEDFIELAVFANGVLQKKARGVEYNVLEETLAKRTYDESGDYTVSAFGIRVREHLDNGTNDGLYPAPTGKEDKFVVGVEAGKAYVKGFAVETVSTTYVENTKARTTQQDNNFSTVAAVDSFVIARSPNKLLNTTGQPLITFYNSAIVTPGTAPLTQVIGTARARYIKRYDAGGGDNGLFIYLYDFQNVFASVSYPGSSFITSAASMVCVDQGWTATVNESYIQFPQRHSALFKLPVKDAKSISDVSFTVRRTYTGTTDGTGLITITAGTSENFMQPIVNESCAEIDGTHQEIFNLASLGGSPVGKTLTINFGASKANKSVRISVDVLKSAPVRKTKTKTAFSVTVPAPTALNNRRAKIQISDLIEVTSIKEGAVERKHAYSVITNTTDEFYGVAEVRLNDYEPVYAGNITVEGYYYAHSAGDYISAESYTDGYSTIPKFTLNNTEVNLSDYIDFRPKAPNTGNDFSGTGGSITEMVAPYGVVTFDNEYYLPRIDIVYVTSRGEFGVVNGIPSLDPKVPSTPDNAMAIYKMFVPAFTNSVKDIQIEYINNRRYTMRDIGKIEDRVSKLEYYTTLNMLEVETQSMQITNGAGLNRFKNGFVVDNFADHSIGYFSSPQYKCSISAKENLLRPEFNAEFVDFDYASGQSTNVVKTGSLITLPYTQKTFVSQLLASGTMNVNPYAVYNWIGNMALTPSTDTWFDTRYTNPDVTYQIYNNGRLTQQWNSWTLNWAGGVENDVTDLWNQTIRTTTTTNIAVVGEKEVDRTVIPYMRSKSIAFNAKGLLPKSKVYPFFDNVSVGAYCKPAGGAFGDPIVTNADGEVSGEFAIPNEPSIKFRTGSKQFTLIDNPSNDRVASISTADADYTAAGVLVTKTQSIVATQQINTVTTRVTARDPLAQSFLVDKKGGVFLTSVDLYFATKDTTVPVTLEVRSMENGYPGQHILPYSTTTLKPSQVSTSNDGSVATTFTFGSPVYLADGQEYCFVVLSNCNAYNVYIATMGEKQLNTNTYISKQPFVGVMFKSQNNTTWTAEQTSDMKFIVRIAEFNTNVSGKAVFENATIPKVKLGSNPLFASSGSNTVRVNIPSHGMVIGSKFTVSGAEAANGFTTGQLNATHTVTAVNDSDTVSVTMSSNATVAGAFGGANIIADRNIQICTLHGMSQQLRFEDTDITWKYSGVTGRSVSGSETAYNVTPEFNIPINNNTDLSAPLMICSQTDVSGRAFAKSGKMVADMRTYSSNISPVIDVERVGLVCVANKVNSVAASVELTSNTSTAEARYMTKVVGLSTPAAFLRVYMDVQLPSDAEVLLYCRTGNSESDVLANSWTQITPTSPMYTSPAFVEHAFEKSMGSTFTSYQFKIVMLSKSACNVPKVKRFRGIALAT